jgi:hypothetical protein
MSKTNQKDDNGDEADQQQKCQLSESATTIEDKEATIEQHVANTTNPKLVSQPKQSMRSYGRVLLVRLVRPLKLPIVSVVLTIGWILFRVVTQQHDMSCSSSFSLLQWSWSLWSSMNVKVRSLLPSSALVIWMLVEDFMAIWMWLAGWRALYCALHCSWYEYKDNAFNLMYEFSKEYIPAVKAQLQKDGEQFQTTVCQELLSKNPNRIIFREIPKTPKSHDGIIQELQSASVIENKKNNSRTSIEHRV